jgi:hypothetical protein
MRWKRNWSWLYCVWEVHRQTASGVVRGDTIETEDMKEIELEGQFLSSVR